VKFLADFANAAGETRTIEGTLTAADLATVARYRKSGTADPDLVAKALALRHAYKTIGGYDTGWGHVAYGVRLIPVN
jgi:hypothetical protein